MQKPLDREQINDMLLVVFSRQLREWVRKGLMAEVLIADDDVDLADVWRRALETDGHIVTVVNTGSAAIEKLKSNHYDVIVTDVIMPDAGGVVVSGMARLHLDRSAVIAVSGYLDDIAGRAKRDFLKNLGVKHVLPKPVDLNELSRLVADLAKSSSAT